MADDPRYKVTKVTHYEVVDTHAAEEAQKVHWNGQDKDFADQLADDLNLNHKNQVEAQERIQQEARDAKVLEFLEEGKGRESS